MEFTLWLLGFVYASLYAFTYDPVLAVSTLSPDMTQSTRAAETTASYTEYLNDSMTTTNVNFEPDLSKEEAENINNKAKSFLTDLLDGIDPRLRPVSNDEIGPVTVMVNFHIASISSISEVNMDYQVDLYFRQSWIDRRLAYNITDLGPTAKKGYFKLDQSSRDKIWIPDVFFPNEKKALFHYVTVPNFMIKIFPNGEIIYSSRITMVLSCKMILSAFPLDSQICPFNIESYALETDEMLLAWKNTPITLNPNLELPQFALEIPIETTHCISTYKTGHFPCLLARFHMKRYIGYYLLQTYIPSGLIVILSWVAFWINKEAIPARVSLSVVTVMTMVAQLAGSKSSIPNVSYLKAVDLWMMMGMVFVFAALIEYAILNSLERHAKQKTQKPGDYKIDEETPEKKKPRKDPSDRVDEVSRIIFPLAFIIFNLVYWPYYTSGR